MTGVQERAAAATAAVVDSITEAKVGDVEDAILEGMSHSVPWLDSWWAVNGSVVATDVANFTDCTDEEAVWFAAAAMYATVAAAAPLTVRHVKSLALAAWRCDQYTNSPIGQEVDHDQKRSGRW